MWPAKGSVEVIEGQQATNPGPSYGESAIDKTAGAVKGAAVGFGLSETSAEGIDRAADSAKDYLGLSNKPLGDSAPSGGFQTAGGQSMAGTADRGGVSEGQQGGEPAGTRRAEGSSVAAPDLGNRAVSKQPAAEQQQEGSSLAGIASAAMVAPIAAASYVASALSRPADALTSSPATAAPSADTHPSRSSAADSPSAPWPADTAGGPSAADSLAAHFAASHDADPSAAPNTPPTGSQDRAHAAPASVNGIQEPQGRSVLNFTCAACIHLQALVLLALLLLCPMTAGRI